MKKIIFINKNLWSFYNFRYELAKKISKNNKVYCLYGGSNKHPQKKIHNVEYNNVGLSQKPISLFRDIKYIINLYSFIKKSKPDIVHCFNPKPILISFFSFIFFKKIKVYLTITGLGHSYLTRNIFLKYIFNLLYYLSFLRADKIFFQNKYDLKFFKNKGFLKNVKTYSSIGLGVKIKNKLKKSKSKKKISFGFVSRITTEKGIFEYLKAAQEIQKKYPKDSKFYLVKNFDDNSLVGIKENYLNFFLSKLKLKIFYLKFDNDIRKIFDKIDVVVFPSYREGASKTLMEACSFGKVIMAADVPGCNNIVFHKKNGLLFKSRSSKSIYTSMENILKNKSKLKKMSQFSFNFAREKLDQNKIIKLMEKHY